MKKLLKPALASLALAAAINPASAQVPILGELFAGDALGGLAPTSIVLPVPSDPSYVFQTLSSVGSDLLADPAPLFNLLTNTGLPFLQDQTPVVTGILGDPATAGMFLLDTGASFIALP